MCYAQTPGGGSHWTGNPLDGLFNRVDQSSSPSSTNQALTTRAFPQQAQAQPRGSQAAPASGPNAVARSSPIANGASPFRAGLSIPTASPSNGAGLNIPS